MAANSLGRRSAQTALYHIVQALVRWMAPILSFTADEIWACLPNQTIPSIQLTTWYENLAELPDYEIMNCSYWEKIRNVRDAVNKEIENQRNEAKIGSSLEAEVFLYCGAGLMRELETLEDELRFVLMTSFAKAIPDHAGPVDAIITDVPGLLLEIKATSNEKCVRCWHRRPDVNQNEEYPGICGRCVENVAGTGEERFYA